MSQEEQDLVLGQLTREHSECKKEVAAIKGAIDLAGQRLTAVSQTLLQIELLVPTAEVVQALRVLKETPQKAELIALLLDLESNKARLSALSARLAEFH